MSSNSSTSSEERGNTVSLSPLPKKQSPIALRWLFVLNNYTNEDISSIVPTLSEECKILSIGKEIGESGTPHLQGYCEFKRKIRPKSLGLTQRIHWGDKDGRPCKKHCSREANLKYTQKEGNVLISKGVPLPIKLISPDFDWEKEILTIIQREPDDRTTHWF